MRAFKVMVEWVKQSQFHTLRSQRDTLWSACGATPACADIYSNSKGQFFREPFEYQVAACLAIQQIGE